MFNKKAFNHKKSIAVALAFSTFINLFGISANTAYQAEAKSLPSTSKNKLVRFIKNHPVLTAVGATTTFVGACVGATVLALGTKDKNGKTNVHIPQDAAGRINDAIIDDIIPQEKINVHIPRNTTGYTNNVTINKTIPNDETKSIYTQEVPTVLNGMTDQQIIFYRNQQIEKFEKIGEGAFEVSEAFISSLPPKVAALVIAEVNEILEAYPNITRALVGHRKEHNLKFRIRLTYTGETSIGDGTLAMNHFGDIAFNIDYFGSLKELWSVIKNDVLDGYKSPADDVKLAQRTVAHEIGHLIAHTLSFCSVKDYKCYYDKSKENNGKEEATIMKEEIIKIAEEKFGYYGNRRISEYGEKNDDEWIAEVSAHAFCSEKPNALGLAYKEFLRQQEKALSGPSISPFESIQQNQPESELVTASDAPSVPQVA